MLHSASFYHSASHPLQALRSCVSYLITIHLSPTIYKMTIIMTLNMIRVGLLWRFHEIKLLKHWALSLAPSKFSINNIIYIQPDLNFSQQNMFDSLAVRHSPFTFIEPRCAKAMETANNSPVKSLSQAHHQPRSEWHVEMFFTMSML